MFSSLGVMGYKFKFSTGHFYNLLILMKKLFNFSAVTFTFSAKIFLSLSLVKFFESYLMVS